MSFWNNCDNKYFIKVPTGIFEQEILGANWWTYFDSYILCCQILLTFFLKRIERRKLDYLISVLSAKLLVLYKQKLHDPFKIYISSLKVNRRKDWKSGRLQFLNQTAFWYMNKFSFVTYFKIRNYEKLKLLYMFKSWAQFWAQNSPPERGWRKTN